MLKPKDRGFQTVVGPDWHHTQLTPQWKRHVKVMKIPRNICECVQWM